MPFLLVEKTARVGPPNGPAAALAHIKRLCAEKPTLCDRSDSCVHRIYGTIVIILL